MKLFRKTLAILLSVALVLAAIPAVAAKTDPEAASTGANNGPSTSYSYIKASLSQGDKFSTVIYSYEDEILKPYGDKLVYNKSTNTLTVKDLEAYALDINEMGEDFKIVVEGYNKLDYITVWGYGWGGSAYITGSGVLDLDLGLGLEAEESASVLTIDNNVSLYSHSGMIYVNESTAAQPMVVKGRELSGGTVGYYRRSPYPIKTSYSEDYTRDGRVYRNTTKPYSNYSGHENDEYFVVIDHPESKEQRNGEWQKCNKFEICAAVKQDGEWKIDSTLNYIYVWDDSIQYQMFKKDPERMQISDVDPHYVEVDNGYEYKEMTVIRDADGDPMTDIAIVPKSSAELNRPLLLTDTLPEATMNKPYSTQIVGQPGNSGGEIYGYSLTIPGDDPDWLTLDSNGVLSGTAPSDYGIYDIKVAVIEKVGDKEVRSVTKKLTVKVDIPDNCILFGKTIATGCSHVLTVNDSSGKTVRTIYLGAKDLTPTTCIDLGDLPAGNYQAILTGEFSGEEVIYNGNTENFTVTQGQKTRVTLDPDTEIAYPDSSVVLTLDGFSDAKGLSDLLATVTLSNGSAVKREVTRQKTVIPNCLSDKVTLKSISVTAKDDAGQVFEIAAGDSPNLTVDPDTFRDYTVNCYAFDINNIRLRLNNLTFPVKAFEDCTLHTLTASDVLSFDSALFTDENKKKYDLSSDPAVSFNDDSIRITFTELDRSASLSGTVTDSDDEPISGVAVSCTQTINKSAVTFSAVTDEDGCYEFKNIYNGKYASVAFSKNNYPSVSRSLLIEDDSECDATMTAIGGVTVRFTDYVSLGRITWSGADEGFLSFSGGYSCTLPVLQNVNGQLTVKLNGENVAGTVSGTVTVTRGTGELTLNPVKKGVIDWSGVGAQGSETACYTAYPIRITGTNFSKLFAPQNCGYIEVNPGEYTVSVLKSGSNEAYESQKLTVKADETSYVDISLPSGAKAASVSSGTLTGPRTAANGEVYKLSGLITSIDGSKIKNLRFQIGDTMSWSDNIDHVVINGKSAAIRNGIVANDEENASIDWSLPLNFTVYCTQEADAQNTSQRVTAYVTAKDEALIGTVVTKYVPNLTLKTVSTVSAATDSENNVIPDPVSFTGKSVPNTEIKLYDNDILRSVTTADSNGNYSGELLLAGADYFHTIRAEAEFGSEKVTAKSFCTCITNGAVLQSLTMDGEAIPINGGKIAYTTVPTDSIKFSASFKNADMLDDITYTINHKEVTSKVFFKVSTISGYELLPATPNKTGDLWTSEEYYHGADYPTGVKVLYLSKLSNYSGSAEFDDDEPAQTGSALDSPQDNAGLAATSANASNFNYYIERADRYEGDYNGFYDTESWIGDILGNSDTLNDDTLNPRDKIDKLYQQVSDVLNRNAGIGSSVSAITAEQAAQRAPSNKAQLRTYVDAPAYTVTNQNLQLRKSELEAKGYESLYYKDRKSGHEVCVFKGTFYYGANAQPVPSVTVTNVYNGVPTVEEDKRLYDNNKPIGSTLDVIYICDKTAKKWLRTQSALLSPGAASPIHTYSTQVPSKQEQPNAYKPDAISPVGQSAGALASTGASALAPTGDPQPKDLTGLCFSIDTSKVSTKNYVSFGISAAGFLGSAWLDKCFKGNTKLISPEKAKQWKLVNDKGEALGTIFKPADLDIESTLFTKNMYFINMGASAAAQGSSEPHDVFGGVQSVLTQKIRWLGKLETVCNSTDDKNNGGALGDYRDVAFMAHLMKERTAKMQNALTDVEAAIESARSQGEFTDNVTEGLGYLSLAVGFVPGYGYAVSFCMDGASFLLNAAKDTHNADVIRAVENFTNELLGFNRDEQEVEKAVKKIDEIVKRNRDKHPGIKTMEELMDDYDKGNFPIPTADDDDNSDDDNPEDNDEYNDEDCELTPVHDPSGVVYEAVLSNPVAGAEVTLQRYHNAQDPLAVWDDSDYLKQANPLLTDENGCFRWDVPEGEWFVTATKSGYVSGSSQNDKAATVTHGDVNYLPVLPPQLNVNIPLISYKVPEVESATAKTDGVYIKFSKYMDESKLTAENFTLSDPQGEPITFTLEKLDSEQAPDNINYSGSAPSYTRTVKLSANLNSGAELILRVSGDLSSYAGVPMSAAYLNALTVASKTAYSAPTFSVDAGEVDKGTVVTLSCANGAEIIYTTDGSDPSADNGIRAKSGVQVSLIISTTLKAIAVGAGSDASKIAEATYTVNGIAADEPPVRLVLGDVDGDGSVTIVDATMIQRHLASLPTSAYHEEAADTDGDGKVTILDATAIQRFLAELDCPDGIGEAI